MFVGHYAAAMAAKAAEPKAPLWAYVIGCQMLDVGWSLLVMAGIEKFRIDPSLRGSPLDLYFMPFTHSLPGAVFWAILGGLLAWGLLRLPRNAAVMVGLVVFSHWVLDLIVHRPDLDLGNGIKVGLSFWNWPVAEMACEMGMVAVAGTAWAIRAKADGANAWPIAVFAGLMGPLAMTAIATPTPASPVAAGAMILLTYGLVTLASLGFDRPRSMD
jgi:hypothetical protein